MMEIDYVCQTPYGHIYDPLLNRWVPDGEGEVSDWAYAQAAHLNSLEHGDLVPLEIYLNL